MNDLNQAKTVGETVEGLKDSIRMSICRACIDCMQSYYKTMYPRCSEPMEAWIGLKFTRENYSDCITFHQNAAEVELDKLFTNEIVKKDMEICAQAILKVRI